MLSNQPPISYTVCPPNSHLTSLLTIPPTIYPTSLPNSHF
jgi:hypothetical protein